MTRNLKLLAKGFLAKLPFAHHRTAELIELCYLARLFKYAKIDRVIDIGANKGQYYSRVRSIDGKVCIISIEPDPSCFNHLQEKTKGDINALALCKCVTTEDNFIPGLHLNLHKTSNSEFNSVHKPSNLAHQAFPDQAEIVEIISTPATSISNILKIASDKGLTGARTLLKLDTQGGDIEILLGSKDFLNEFAAIQLEVPFVRLYDTIQNHGLENLIACLDDQGFSLSAILPNNGGHQFPILYEQDVVFVNKTILAAG